MHSRAAALRNQCSCVMILYYYLPSTTYYRQVRTRQVVEGLRAAAAFREMGARELAMIACGGKPRRLPRYAACSTRGQLLLTMRIYGCYYTTRYGG